MCCRLPTYNAHGAIEGKSTNGEDLADGDDDVAEEEELHFPKGC